MSKRCVFVLLAGAIFLAGLTLTRQSIGQDEPPVRFKKKKPRGDDKPKTEPAKPDDKKKDEKKDDKKAEPREAEPVMPQEEEKEVLQRIVKNVHNVEERLAKNDLGEGTQQTQRDILKDIESLIRRSENPPQSGGQQDQNKGSADQNANENKDQQDSSGEQSQGQRQRSKSGQKPQGNSSGQKPRSGSGAGQKSQGQRDGGRKIVTKPGDGSKPGGAQPAGKNGDGKEPGGKNGKNGNGGGNDKNDRARNKSADVYKADWGHLPATLRPQMDAYSNPQPFLPKYDDLIKRYYRTIAEQGRRKGD